MKNIILILFVFALSLTGLRAQDAAPVKSYKYIFKANINYSQRHFGNFTIGNLAPDWVIKNKKGNLHEFELTEVSVNRREYLKYGKQKSSSFQVRYQYDILLIKKDKKIIPFIGFSAAASSIKSTFSSSDTIHNSNRSFNTSLRFGVVPGVYFFPCKNISIDFSMPLGLTDLRYNHRYEPNPNIPSGQKTQSSIDFNTHFLNTLRFRLGVGIRI